MKHLFSFLIIAALLASCGTSNSFSKRKHLSGHFWKKSGGHGKPHENNFESSEFSDNEAVQAEKGDLGISAGSMTENQNTELGESTTQEMHSERLGNYPEILGTTSTTDSESIEIQKELKKSEAYSPTSNQSIRENEELGILYIVMVTVLVLASIGVVFLIIWVIFKILAIVGLWLLITGLTILGVAFLIYLGLMIWLLAIT